MVVDSYQFYRNTLDKQEKQWNAVFPAEQKLEEDCLLFISRMSYIAFSEYLLSREIVSPKVFKRRRIGDIIFHTFNKEFRWGSKLSDMMRGIGEAIKLKYARQAFIMINEDDEDHDLATEVFTMTFAYSEDDCLKITDENGNSILSMGYKGKEALRKQVGYLIQKITAVCNGLKKFNKSVTPFIKLTYYDERTPPDYQPFAFQHCDTTFIFKVVPPRFEFGNVSTNYAAGAIDIQSIYIDNMDALEEANVYSVDYRTNSNFLDVTVDGDITLNEASNLETENLMNRSDSLEMARIDDEQDVQYVESAQMHYDRDTALQDESDNVSDQSPDTTNEEEYSPAKSLGKKATSMSRKRGQERGLSVKKTTLMKSPSTARTRVTRATSKISREGLAEVFTLPKTPTNQTAPIVLDGGDVQNDESAGTIVPWQLNKVSKAFTSPNHHIVSPNRRRLPTGCLFKSSVITRTVDRSPSDNEV